MNLQRYLHVAGEVDAALRRGRPVVAFDTSSAACDMPPGQRLAHVRAREAAAREAGAVPASVAVLEGVLHLGLSAAQLEALCEMRDVPKLSRRELAAAVALGRTGAATASCAMVAATLCGVRVYAAGAIGGVGPGMDVSADLQELRESSVAAVCAAVGPGADGAASAELLETLGVPVLGLDGPAGPALPGALLPAGPFYTVETAARIARAHWDLGLAGSVLVCPPMPALDEALAEQARAAVASALADARFAGVHGPQRTPALTAHLLTASAAYAGARRALTVHCARTAAALAAALAGA